MSYSSLYKILLLLLLLTPLLLKGWYVDQFIFSYTGTRLLGFVQVLVNDAALYCGIMLLLYISFLSNVHRAFSALLRLIAFIVFIAYIVDYFVIVNFNTHLALNDAVKYAAYSYKYLQQIYGITGLVLMALLLALPVYFSWARFSVIQPFHPKWPIFIVLIMPLAAAFADNEKYAHAWIYKNVIDYNLTIFSEAAAYTKQFSNDLNFREAYYCHDQAAERKNIIILMVESLSAYHSRFFSGINDWTPNLDAIAQQHLAYKNFYANGFITEDGEVALLTGLAPVYPPSTYTDDGGTSFYSFYQLQHSLPRLLKNAGYHSEFLTTADLEFGNTGPWADSVGFDYLEGHQHPEYNQWERFHFQAAPDEALYRRVMDRVKQNDKNPYLIFVKTVSSHHPYVNPENKHHSEAEAIAYTDKQIGLFYRQLQKHHFFDNGILVIVGDHHSMTPLKKAEIELFGDYKASARIPLIIADDRYAAEVDDHQFQQIDVFNTLRGTVAGRQCYSDWMGILWGDFKKPPEYIIHRRGDNRDMVSVFAEHEDYLLKLDGNDTRVYGTRPENIKIRQLLVDKLNTLRLARVDWASRHSAEKSE